MPNSESLQTGLCLQVKRAVAGDDQLTCVCWGKYAGGEAKEEGAVKC